MRSQERILCEDCVKQKTCRTYSDDYRCVACSRYYKRPTDICGWIKYRWRNLKNRFGYYRFLLADRIAWRRFCRRCGKIPSVIKPGDVIEFTFPDEIELQCGGKPGTVHKKRILRMWTDLGWTHEGWRLHVKCNVTADLSNTVCYGSGNEIELELPKRIVSINGKTAIPKWGV